MKFWMLTWGELEFVADDLTVAHVALIAPMLDRSGDTWDISPTLGPMHLLANLAAFLSIATETAFDVTLGVLSTVPYSTLRAALTES